MSHVWSDEHRRKVREYAVSDVLDGMSMIGAAVVWDVQVADLKRWVDEAHAAAEPER